MNDRILSLMLNRLKAYGFEQTPHFAGGERYVRQPGSQEIIVHLEETPENIHDPVKATIFTPKGETRVVVCHRGLDRVLAQACWERPRTRLVRQSARSIFAGDIVNLQGFDKLARFGREYIVTDRVEGENTIRLSFRDTDGRGYTCGFGNLSEIDKYTYERVLA